MYAYNVFDTLADRYDAWYDTPKGRALLTSEVACLRPLVSPLPRPTLEVGVGTGRFAAALGLTLGLDPSRRALAYAQRRGVKVLQGIGEALPFADASLGGVVMVFTLCFVSEPRQVFREALRVLIPSGGLVLGLLLKGTPWADWYAHRGAEGDPLYRTAHFYTKGEVETFLTQAGFRITACRSTLFQPPGLATYREEQPRNDFICGAGFVAVAAQKQ